MTSLTLEQEINEAIDEAIILECAHSTFDTNRVLETAQRLSLAPFSFVEMTYRMRYAG